MKSLILPLLTAASIPVITEAAPTKSPAKDVVTTVPELWSMPLLNTGFKTNDEYIDGNMSLTIPVWSTIGRDGRLGGDYLFLEPYVSIGTGGETAASLGVAWRHLFSDEPVSALHKQGMAGFVEEGWFIGASLFADNLSTTHDNDFWQLGVGAEIGTRYLELRGNYYIPLTSEKLADRSVSTQRFSSSSTKTTTTGSGIGEPYATGNLIAQDVNLTTFATTTTRTTTVRTVTEIFEKGMEGWDVEASVLLPWVDQWAEVRVIGGYYSYDNQPFGPQEFGTGNVRGWKAGVEVRPVPAVILSGTWYEDQRLTGDHWTVGLQLQIPLDRKWKDSFKPRRRHLVERLAEPVHRQNNAIKIGNSKEEQTTVKSSVKRVTRIVAQTNQRIVLADDIVFVNNGAPVGNGIQAGNDVTGNGTAERPKATIQAGANIAQGNSNATGRVWNVYTQGTAAGYTEDVISSVGSVNFIGSGRRIAGLGGKSFGKGPMPRLTGGFEATDIPFFGATAYRISGGLVTGLPDGFRLRNVRQFVIEGNSMGVVSDGISLHLDGANTMNGVARNNVGAAGRFGVVMFTEDFSTAGVVFEGNTFFNSGLTDIHAESFDNSRLRVTATGNRLTNGNTTGFYFGSHQTSRLQFAGFGNQLQGNDDQGFEFRAGDDSGLSAVVADNRLSAIGGTGVVIGAAQNATFNVSVLRNQMTTVGNDGVNVIMANDSVGVTNIGQNAMSAIGDNAMFFNLDDDVLLGAVVSGNSIQGTPSHGLLANTQLNARLNLLARQNSIVNPLNAGIELHTEGDSVVLAQLPGNRIMGSSQLGIELHAQDTSELNVFMGGATIANPGAHGLQVTAQDDADLNLAVGTSTFSNPGIQHVVLTSSDTATLDSVFDLNRFTTQGAIAGGGRGLLATSLGTSAQTLEATGNSITDTGLPGSGSSGFHLVANGDSTFYAEVQENLVRDVQSDSMTVETGGSGQMEAYVLHNTIIGTQASPGIFGHGTGEGMFVSLGFNTISNSLQTGVTLRVDNGSQLGSMIGVNSILNSGDTALLLHSTPGGTLTVVNFLQNTLTGGPNVGINLLEEAGSTLSIDGIPAIGNNIINGFAGFRVFDVNSSVLGVFHMGAPVNADRLNNSSVP
jgi:hypothetical protein